MKKNFYFLFLCIFLLFSCNNSSTLTSSDFISRNDSSYTGIIPTISSVTSSSREYFEVSINNMTPLIDVNINGIDVYKKGKKVILSIEHDDLYYVQWEESGVSLISDTYVINSIDRDYNFKIYLYENFNEEKHSTYVRDNIRYVYNKEQDGYYIDGLTSTIIDDNKVPIVKNIKLISTLFVDKKVLGFSSTLSNKYLEIVNSDDSFIFLNEGTFKNCSSLVSIKLNEGLKLIPKNCFEGCSSLKNITLPNSIEIIDDNAFSSTGLTKISLPNRVKSINNFSFSNSKISEINIPTSVKSIGSFAFFACENLKSIVIPNTVTSFGENYVDESGTTKHGYVFSSCSSLIKVILRASISVLPDSTFSSCYSLKEIELSSTLIEIEKEAFHSCTSLVSITLNNNISYIGNDAFNNCSSLKNINIPTALTSLSSRIFANCSNLETINILENITSINQEAFYNCISLKKINIPSKVKEINNRTFYNCKSLVSILLPTSLNSIYDSAFYNCISLNSINIDNIKTINSNAFF